MNEDDAVRAALSQYYDSSRPAGYAASFRAGWDAGRIHEAGVCTHGRESDAALETAESVAQMAAHDRDEALENFAQVEQEYAQLRAWLEPLEAWASNVLVIVKERCIPSAGVIADGEAIITEARAALLAHAPKLDEAPACGEDDGSTVCVREPGHQIPHRSADGRQWI